MNPKVEWFFKEDSKWQKEFRMLRTIILGCDLQEELKWGQPCYLYQGRNIVLIHGFKEYCALLFFKGSLMKDPKHILVQQTENVQAARQLRFTSVSEIRRLEKAIRAYVYEAVSVEESGAKVPLKKPSEFASEFQEKLDGSAALRKAFSSLTPGRQRAYLLYFSQAAQSKTRASRVAKYLEKILEGKGKDD